MSTRTFERPENPKHVQGDGAGFGRLRAAQRLRQHFAKMCKFSAAQTIYIDEVRDYAGVKIVFYRAQSDGQSEQARVAVMKFYPIDDSEGVWRKEHDIIANINN